MGTHCSGIITNTKTGESKEYDLNQNYNAFAALAGVRNTRMLELTGEPVIPLKTLNENESTCRLSLTDINYRYNWHRDIFLIRSVAYSDHGYIEYTGHTYSPRPPYKKYLSDHQYIHVSNLSEFNELGYTKDIDGNDIYKDVCDLKKLRVIWFELHTLWYLVNPCIEDLSSEMFSLSNGSMVDVEILLQFDL